MSTPASTTTASDGRSESQAAELQIMRNAYGHFVEWLQNEQSSVQEVYAKLRESWSKWKESSQTRKKNKREWNFNEDRFPSLWQEGLGVLRPDEPFGAPSLARWEPNAVREAVHTDLERLLLAFIWKQGDFQKVRYVFESLGASRANPQKAYGKGGESPSVLAHFGKHLADPCNVPIFDQHTARARRLIVRYNEWTDLESFRNLFVGPHAIPLKAAALTGKSQCDKYSSWWSATVGKRLPPVDAPERRKAMLLADKILFGLGEWATPRRWEDKDTQVSGGATSGAGSGRS